MFLPLCVDQSSGGWRSRKRLYQDVRVAHLVARSPVEQLKQSLGSWHYNNYASWPSFIGAGKFYCMVHQQLIAMAVRLKIIWWLNFLLNTSRPAIVTTGMLLGNLSESLLFWQDIDWQLIVVVLARSSVGVNIRCVFYSRPSAMYCKSRWFISLVPFLVSGLKTEQSLRFMVGFLPAVLPFRDLMGVAFLGPCAKSTCFTWIMVWLKKKMIATNYPYACGM